MDLVLDGLGEALRLIATADAHLLHAVSVSITCTLTAVVAAAVIAIPYGAWLAFYRSRSPLQVTMLRVGMSVPTVVIGLVVYALLSRSGLLGGLDLLYTRTAIIVGEFLLAFPLLATLSHAVAVSLDRVVVESALTLGASRWRALWRSLGEERPALAAALLAAFGRCITELGIAITVGGNLAHRTRTLPSTIQLELSRGRFGEALAPGIVLLAIAIVATVATHWLSGERRR
ncbi:MAG: ABC transporter permease [Planctomycetes bacterium]|nr:ABC transporter permease [Planctomycetota bacterium]